MKTSSNKPASVNDNVNKGVSPAESFIKKQQMISNMGWICFVFTFVVFMGYVFIDKITPSPERVIDEHGRLLGYMNYIHPSNREDIDILGDGAYFLENYLSLNSGSIYLHSATYLNMMCDELKHRTIEEMKNSDYLQKIKSAGHVTRIEFYKGAKRPRVLSRDDNFAKVLYEGELILTETNKKIKEFKVILEMKLIPRGLVSNRGIQVCKIDDAP